MCEDAGEKPYSVKTYAEPGAGTRLARAFQAAVNQLIADGT